MALADIDSQLVDTESEDSQPTRGTTRASRFSVPLVFAIVALTGCAFAMGRWSALPPGGTFLSHRDVADVRAIESKTSKGELERIESNAKKAFDHFDEDKDGYLADEEIDKLLEETCQMFGAGSHCVSDDQLAQVKLHIDEDKNGKFCFKEMYKVIFPVLQLQLDL